MNYVNHWYTVLLYLCTEISRRFQDPQTSLYMTAETLEEKNTIQIELDTASFRKVNWRDLFSRDGSADPFGILF